MRCIIQIIKNKVCAIFGHNYLLYKNKENCIDYKCKRCGDLFKVSVEKNKILNEDFI